MFVDLHSTTDKRGQLIIPLLSRSARKFRGAHMKSKTMYQRVWLNPDSSLLDHEGALFHFSAVYVSNSGPRLFQSGGLEIASCPFAKLPEKKRTIWAVTKEETKNCIWLRPELIAPIEFAEWTPDSRLRHSKFVGLREDKAVVRE
jgi:ATP dependent DNA ligase C terminal region